MLGAPSNLDERAKMPFTISYKSQIVIHPYESLFNFFLCALPPSSVLLPPSSVSCLRDRAIRGSAAVVVRAAAATVTVLCCVVAASSFFFSFEVSYPSSSIAVCLWLLLLVLLIDCVFLGVHCVCLLLHWHFLRVFIVFFLVFYENEAYRLAIHI